jgi:nitrilase
LENYVPLARYTLYAWGTQIYVAATWDRGETWLSTLRHIAKEGRVYIIGCGMALRQADIPVRYDFKRRFYTQAGEWINGGDSAIVEPNGHFIAGPVNEREEILYAQIDPLQMGGPKWILDVAGHYAHPDIFRLSVLREPYRMIRDQPQAGELADTSGSISLPATVPVQ